MSITDNEIIKELKGLASYSGFVPIITKTLNETIALINHQKVEIEKLNEIKSQLESDLANERLNYEVFKNNYEELEQELHYLSNVEIPYLYSFTEDKDKKLETLANILLEARKKAIKEFAEKLKSEWTLNDYYCEDIDILDWIDNLANKINEVK